MIKIASLAVKYRPKTFEDMTEQKIVVDILRKLVTSPVLDNRNFLFIGSAGVGKAQPMDSNVLTPAGFIKMKDVKVGTKVFTSSGAVAYVSGVYPQGVRSIYEIELQDRTVIRVSDEHLNVFYCYNDSKKLREDYCMTTLELLDFYKKSKFKLRMDVPKVDWPASELPIDPYLVGALIGDGSLSNNFEFSNSEEDVVERIDSILRRDWGKCLRKVPGDNVDYDIVDVCRTSHKYTFYFQGNTYLSLDAIQDALVLLGYPKFDDNTILNIANNSAPTILKRYPELLSAVSVEIDESYRHTADPDPFREALVSLGMLTKSVHKHIPKQYLLSDRESRIELLRGLYDTDGYTDKDGSTIFTTCSDQLSEDFAFLVRSLGIRDTVVDYPAKYKKGHHYIYTGSTAHDHILKIPNELIYCSSEKHMNRRIIRQNPPLRNIVDIRYVGEEECQCIMVDHEDHTYISDGFIPTHNTTLCRIIANQLNEGLGEPIEIDAASYSGVDKMREIVAQAHQYPVGCKYKVFIIDECHALSSASWQSALKVLEESPAKTIFMFATTNPEKIPATILSRVQTFQLSKISLDGIKNRLMYVLESEIKEGRNITYTEDAVTYIAKLANGGMRDALTLLDKALAYSSSITSESLMSALNLPEYDDYFALLAAYAKRDNVKITEIVHTVYNSGINFVKWFEGFHSFVMNLVKYIFLQDIEVTMIPSHYLNKVSKYGSAHSAICLKLANKLLKLNSELKTTQYLQEVALTYLCQLPKKGE